MDGEELYGLYIDASAAEDTLVDHWDDLDDSTKAIWNRLASVITDLADGF